MRFFPGSVPPLLLLVTACGADERSSTFDDAVVDPAHSADAIVRDYERGTAYLLQASRDGEKPLVTRLEVPAEELAVDPDTRIAVEREVPETPAIVTRQLVGADDRSPRGIYEKGLDHPYAAVGMLSRSGAHLCTATLVGSRDGTTHYAVTAAHCLYTAGGSPQTTSLRFEPRRDGCKKANAVDTIAGCDGTPYGTWSLVADLVPAYYDQNCRSGAATGPCKAQDIAIVRLTRPAGEPYPAAMAHPFALPSDVYSYNLRLYGYPGCGGPDDPTVKCRTDTLYAQSQCPMIPSTNQPDAALHGCDSSEGQSGGPLLAKAPGSTTDVVYAIHGGGGIGVGGFKSGVTPNVARLFTRSFSQQFAFFQAGTP